MITKNISSAVLIALSIGSCVAQQPQRTPGGDSGSQIPSQSSQVPMPSNTGSTQFGALIKPPDQGAGAMNFKINVARKLGLNCIRDGISLDNPKDKPIFNSGFKIVLTVNSSANANKSLIPFATDTAVYKQQLQYQLSLMRRKPVLLVIENEENNQRYHGGPAQDYINQLNAASTVAHASGVPVTNGGITFPAIMYLTWLDYTEHGKTKEAADLQKRFFMPFDSQRFNSRKDFLKQLIAGYAKSNIDYVNFHWYGRNGDTKSLVEVVNYLERVTGKPAISNEIGQQDNSPETVKAILQTCRQLNLRFAIWYSGDGEKQTDEQAVGLQNNDGTLRAGGDIFKDVMK